MFNNAVNGPRVDLSRPLRKREYAVWLREVSALLMLICRMEVRNLN